MCSLDSYQTHISVYRKEFWQKTKKIHGNFYDKCVVLPKRLLILEIQLLFIYRRLQSREFRKAKTNIYLPRQIYLCFEKFWISNKTYYHHRNINCTGSWLEEFYFETPNKIKVEKLLFIAYSEQVTAGARQLFYLIWHGWDG